MNYEEYRMMEEKWIEALAENTKLKAEIDRLKADYKDEMSMANEYTEIMVNQRKEIEQLKADLEQSNEDTNLTIKETIRAVRNCGENSGCDGCFLRIGLDDCWLCNVELEEAEQSLKGKVEE